MFEQKSKTTSEYKHTWHGSKFKKNQTPVTDAVLVTVGFYVGDEKANNGKLPFAFVGAVAAGAMIISEVKSNKNG